MQYSREAAAGQAPGPPLRFTAGGRFESSALVAAGDEAGGVGGAAGGGGGARCGRRLCDEIGVPVDERSRRRRRRGSNNGSGDESAVSRFSG